MFGVRVFVVENIYLLNLSILSLHALLYNAVNLFFWEGGFGVF